MQKIVRAYSWVVHKAMNVSGAEAMAASANVFVGGMESAFTIRPYVNTMTRSEMFALLTAGMATIAGGVLGAYASMGMDAGHLISAQLLSAVGSLVIAKIMIPETESPLTLGNVNIKSDTEDKNIFDAACRGALEGTRVVACVAGILIAFVAITAMINGGLSLLPQIADEALTVERILGWIFTPVVFLTGVPWEDCGTLGGLLGKKMFLNEFLAYIDLAQAKEHVNPRSFMLATYFLCGFANFSVVAMQIGGMGSVFPEKRAIVVELGMKCLFAGTLATLMSACIAGILL
jgi:CNT family concentrative nucleoside transporter